MGDAGADRFALEAKLAARLQHANLVPVLTDGDANGMAYYTMPMVRGETVRERLQRGSVPPAESRAILRDIARALAYAHGEGVVHRDTKPENVLLSGDAALVTDFGIAKAIALSKTEAPGGTLTQVGTSLDTPGYMAPEQAVGDEVDARADLYAWGVMAYELLTGRHPFADKTTGQQLIAAHIAEKPKPLLELVTADAKRDVNVRKLAPLVMQCLEKQPAARPANARAVLDALERPVTAVSSGRSRGRLAGDRCRSARRLGNRDVRAAQPPTRDRRYRRAHADQEPTRHLDAAGGWWRAASRPALRRSAPPASAQLAQHRAARRAVVLHVAGSAEQHLGGAGDGVGKVSAEQIRLTAALADRYRVERELGAGGMATAAADTGATRTASRYVVVLN